MKKVVAKKAAPVKKASVKVPAAKVASRKNNRIITNPANVSSRVVDHIPTMRRGAAKTTQYRDTLKAIRDDVGAGKSVIVAEFTSPTGAALVRRQLLKGVLLCDGEANEWTLTARRVDDGSILYAELNG